MSLEDAAAKTVATSQPRNSGILTVVIYDDEGEVIQEPIDRRQTQVLSAIENALSQGQTAIVGPHGSVHGIYHTLDLTVALDGMVDGKPVEPVAELTGSKKALDENKRLVTEVETLTAQVADLTAKLAEHNPGDDEEE